ncbi:MAG: carboxyl transferase domain-containing protein, partial [Peptostreptococcaceae bacterium]
IKNADDPKSMRDTKIKEYTDEFATPYKAAERGYLDDVIEPSHTRIRLCDALDTLSSKREDRPPKKHGNIPL